MSGESLKEKTAKGLLWGGFGNGMQQLLNLLFGILLARILTPSDYGMVGMLTVFSAIASALQEGGFVSALTCRKEVHHRDYNAVFWFSGLCGISLYILLFFAAPFIARFYGMDELKPLARLSFLAFVVSSFSIAPRAYLFRNLKTKEANLISVLSLLASGVTGVTLAACGWAYWGIVIQSLTFVSVMTVLNFVFARWRPTLPVDFRPIRSLLSFGSKLVITNICTILNNNLFSVVLGRLYSEREVGNFTQANKWNSMGHTLITGMLNGIAQPVLSRVADDLERQKAVFRKMLRFTAFVSFPLMLGLSLMAEELIVIALTDKWADSARILSLLAVWGAFVPVGQLCANLVVSRGHSGVYMGNSIALCVAQLAAVLCSYPWGMTVMLTVFISINILWTVIWMGFVRREIGLSIGLQLKDVAPYALIAGALAAGLWLLTPCLPSNLCLRFIIKAVLMAGLYALVLWRLQSVIFRESIEFIFKRKKK